MATIVTPYNPWRENLAVNVLGGLLNNFLEQNRQAEQNRKVNAFRGQLQQDLQNNIIQEQGNSALSLAQPQAPAGYDSSPWASMFHKTDSPLTQFDIGTSVIPMRDPTVQEISNTADTLGASQRFSMINPETIQGIKAGMIQQAEAQRIRGLQEDYARQFANATDATGRMNAITQGVITGGIPSQALASFSPFAIHDTPHYDFSDMDIGSHKIRIANNPKTGEATPVIVSPMGMSPDQRARIEAQRDIAAMTDNTANRGYDIQEDQNQWERNNPKLERVTDENGRVYNVNPRTGEATSLVDEDNAHIIGDDGQYKLRTELLKSIDKENEQLRRERMLLAETDEDRAIYDEKIRKNLELRKSILQPLLSQYENGVQPTTGATSSVTSNPPGKQTTGQVTSLQSPFVLPVLGNTTGQNISVPSVIPMQSAQQTISTSGDVQRKKMVIKGSDLPSDIWYDPTRDSAVPPENILTREQFGRVIAGIMNNPPKGTEHLTPITIAYQLFKHRGIRVKK